MAIWADLTAYIFDGDWVLGSDVAKSLIVLALCQTLSVPLSCILLLFGRVRSEFFFQLLRLTMTIISFMLCYLTNENFFTTTLAFALTQSFIYLAHLFFQVFLIHEGKRSENSLRGGG